jgi:hypothetical protein
MARAKWVQDRMEHLLPVPYFHVVFTLPRELNLVAHRQPEQFYGLFFRAVSRTLQEVAGNPKRLGGTIGFCALLHTWGQTLIGHPHIHCVVPGGALAADGTWIAAKEKFLLPVAVLRKVVRGKLLDMLRQARDKGGIDPGDPEQFDALIDTLYRKKWHVYCKPPFAGPESVIKYLGRYTHRVAISNQRLLALRDGNVTFSYTDHRRGGVRKTMTLAATEFIRRFLMHVVPDGFVRIRHYGFLANAVREDKLARCRTALGVAQPTQDTSMKDTHWYTIVEQLTGRDPLLCPRCRKGKLRVWKELAPLHSSREAAA